METCDIYIEKENRMNKQQRAVERIKQMEEILDEATMLIDELDGKLKEYERLMPKIKKLEEYYTSKLWKDDLALDEAGKLPKDLKRGVLSQDGIYNILEKCQDVNSHVTF